MLSSEQLLSIMSAEQWSLIDTTRELRISTSELKRFLAHQSIKPLTKLKLFSFYQRYLKSTQHIFHHQHQQIVEATQAIPFDHSSKDTMLELLIEIKNQLDKLK